MIKKYIWALCVVLGAGAAFAVPMCVSNDTITIVLDPSVSGNSSTYQRDLFTWETRFPYGTLSGVAACLSSNYSQVLGGTVANLTDNGATVVGAEQNGRYCWCRMTHPLASSWVFRNGYSSLADCASYCAGVCASFVRSESVLRSGLFGSLGA